MIFKSPKQLQDFDLVSFYPRPASQAPNVIAALSRKIVIFPLSQFRARAHANNQQTAAHLFPSQRAFSREEQQSSEMSTLAAKASNKATAVLVQGDTLVRPSKIPAVLRFPLVVTLSLTLSALLYSFAAEYTSGDLAGVSRSLDQWWQVSVLVAWRT